MRNLLLSLVAVATLAFAAPARAQPAVIAVGTPSIGLVQYYEPGWREREEWRRREEFRRREEWRRRQEWRAVHGYPPPPPPGFRPPPPPPGYPPPYGGPRY